MRTINLTLDDTENAVLSKIAEANGIDICTLIKTVVFERFEDEYDLEIYDRGMEEFNRNPVSYSVEEVRKMLNID